MATRLELQTKLEELLGVKHVYYQPPESTKIEYPAIIYSRSEIKGRFANDAAYSYSIRYEIIVIDRKPDNSVIMKLLSLPYCSYNRSYTSENLNHVVLNLYY